MDHGLGGSDRFSRIRSVQISVIRPIRAVLFRSQLFFREDQTGPSWAPLSRTRPRSIAAGVTEGDRLAPPVDPKRYPRERRAPTAKRCRTFPPHPDLSPLPARQ